MKIAGLTGGIATGKSTVVGMFEELGAKIVDADAIAKDVVTPGKPAYREIVEHFGEGILFEDGQIDREKLGEIIFNNEAERSFLNNSTHPRVFEEMQRQIKSYAESGAKVVLCDVPLLLESGAQSWLKPVILVYANPETQLARLTERDECSEERARARISSQLPIDDKKKNADVIIDNSGTPEKTRAQVHAAWKNLAQEL